MSDLGELDLGDDFGWALGALLRSYRERVAAAVDALPHGTRGYEAMAEILRGGHESQLALAAHLGIDRTVMTYLLDDLERDGLVMRKPNPADRRQRLIVATDHGRDLVEAACAEVVAAQDSVLAGLSARERATLRELLNKAAAADGTLGEDARPAGGAAVPSP